MSHLSLRKFVIDCFTSSIEDAPELIKGRLSEAITAFQAVPVDEKGFNLQKLTTWLMTAEVELAGHPSFQKIQDILLVFLKINEAIHRKVLVGWFAAALAEDPPRLDVIQALTEVKDEMIYPMTAQKTLLLRALIPMVSDSSIDIFALITHFHNALVDKPLREAVARLTSNGHKLSPHYLRLLADTASNSGYSSANIAGYLKQLTEHIVQLKPHESALLSSEAGQTYYFAISKLFDHSIQPLIDFQSHPYFSKFLASFCDKEPTTDFLRAVATLIDNKLFEPVDELHHLLGQSKYPYFIANTIHLFFEDNDRSRIISITRKLLDIETEEYRKQLQSIFHYLTIVDQNLFKREIEHAIQFIQSFTVLEELRVYKLPFHDHCFVQNLMLLNDSDKEDIKGYILAEKELFKGSLLTFHRNWHLAFQAELNRKSSIYANREKSAEHLLKAFSEASDTTRWLNTIQGLEAEGRSRSFSWMCDGLTFLMQAEGAKTRPLVKPYLDQLALYAKIYPIPTVALLQSTAFSLLDMHIAALLTEHHPKLKKTPQLKEHPSLFIEFQTLLAESRNLQELFPRISSLSIEPEWDAFVERTRHLPFYQALSMEPYKERFTYSFLKNGKHSGYLMLLWGLTEELRDRLGQPAPNLSMPVLEPVVYWPSQIKEICDAQPIFWNDAHPPSDHIACQLTDLIRTARQMGMDGTLRGKVMADSIRVLECLRFIKMNQRFLEFAHLHQKGQDPHILSAIFSSDKDRLQHHVIRDPYNNVSVHLYQEREWAFLTSREPTNPEKLKISHESKILFIIKRGAIFMGHASGADRTYVEIQVDPKEDIIRDLLAHPDGPIIDRLLLLKIRTLASLHHIEIPSDLSIDHIHTLQEMITDLVESSRHMSHLSLIIFFHKFVYENEIGCLEARISAASEYAARVNKGGTPFLSDVVQILDSEAHHQYPDFDSPGFDCYQAVRHMAQQKEILDHMEVLIPPDTKPTKLTEEMLRIFCRDTLSYDVSEAKKLIFSSSVELKGIEKNRKMLLDKDDIAEIKNEDDAYLQAEFLWAYFGYRGGLSIKPSLHLQKNSFHFYLENGMRHEEAMSRLYHQWRTTGVIPRPFSDAEVSHSESFDSFVRSYLAKPTTHQNTLHYLYTLEQYVRSDSPDVSDRALLAMIQTLCMAEESPKLHIDAQNAAAFCFLLIHKLGWDAHYHYLGISRTLLEIIILQNQEVALLLLDAKIGPFERASDGNTLRTFAALKQRYEVANRLRVVNPLLPKALPFEHLSQLKRLKQLAFAFYTQSSLISEGSRADPTHLEHIASDITRLVEKLGYRNFEAFISKMPSPFDERVRNTEDAFWLTEASWHFSLFCQDICESIHRYLTDLPSWTAPNLFWQNKLTLLAEDLDFQTLNVIAKKWGLATFESQKELCFRRAYANHLVSLQIEEVAKLRVLHSVDLTEQISNLRLLLQSTVENDELRLVAERLNCPLFSHYVTRLSAQKAAEQIYLLQMVEANDNFAGLERYHLPKDLKQMLKRTVQRKRLSPGRSIEVAPALKFIQDNEMELNQLTAKICARAVVYRLRETPFNLLQARIDHQFLIEDIQMRQPALPMDEKTHLLSFILGVCPPQYNPEDMLTRLTELIFNGVTVSSFKETIFNQGELIFPFLGHASMGYTAPFTQNERIKSIQQTRKLYERQLIDRLGDEEIGFPTEGMTYAHHEMFAFRQKAGGGVELMALGDPAYGEHRLIHKPAMTHDRVLVMGNITKAKNKPIVITSRESVYLLLATFPTEVLKAYLYLVMHGVFPPEALNCELWEPDDTHCDVTITSLGASAQGFSELNHANLLLDSSLPLSPEAVVHLSLVHHISCDAVDTLSFESRLGDFYKAIDSDDPVIVKKYLETYAYYTRHITEFGDGFVGHALRHQKYHAALVLLSYGASPFLSNKEGDTALHLAMRIVPSDTSTPLKNHLLIMMFNMANDHAILLLRNMSGKTAFAMEPIPPEVTKALEGNQLFKEVQELLSIRGSVRQSKGSISEDISRIGLFSHQRAKRERSSDAAQEISAEVLEPSSKAARHGKNGTKGS